jgi:predicted DNA-binding transcriptional regulator AlpA
MALGLQPSFRNTRRWAVRFIRTQKVLEMIGVGRTTLWEMVRDGCFPRPVRITERISGYELKAVEQWMRLRRQGLTWPPSNKAKASAGQSRSPLALARHTDAAQGASR